MNVRGTFQITKKRILFFCLLVSVAAFFLFSQEEDALWKKAGSKKVVVIDNGLEFSFSEVEEKSIGEFLEKKKLSLKEGDSVFPNQEIDIVPNMRIHVSRASEITVHVDEKDRVIRTQEREVEKALYDGKILLDEDDIVKPTRDTTVTSGMKISVTRVEIEEVAVEKAIPFEKKVTEDDKLSFRKTVVSKKGEKGMERQVYRVSSHDGKEVNRKLMKTEVVKKPVTEEVVQGTEVKVGKSHTGAASWYAWTGTMAAANPWLPKGSYVKVTNVDNGKSVIVVINDRGPFVPGRIIDLDKVAFQKIASIGAGVINVKMEEVTN